MDRILLYLLSLLIVLPSFARDPLPPEEAAKIIQEFQYPNNFTFFSNDVSKPLFSRCWIYEQFVDTEYPQSMEPLRVQQHLYIPSRRQLGDKKVPLVILIPPVGGINPLDTQTAKTLCNNNIAALIVANDFANVEYQAEIELLPVEDHQETYYRITAAVKAAIAQVDEDPNLDSEKIGLFGVSLGGILSSFVMAAQERIAAGYFVVAGGDVPDILAHSAQDKIAKIRRRRMQAEGFSTADEYEMYLRQHLQIDPIDISTTMLPETLRMVIAGKDKNVPTSNQWALHVAFGEPDIDFVDKNHLQTILNTLFSSSKRDKVMRFFKKRFEFDNPRPAAFDFLSQFDLNYYM